MGGGVGYQRRLVPGIGPHRTYLGGRRNTLDQSVHLTADEADELARTLIEPRASIRQMTR